MQMLLQYMHRLRRHLGFLSDPVHGEAFILPKLASVTKERRGRRVTVNKRRGGEVRERESDL